LRSSRLEPIQVIDFTSRRTIQEYVLSYICQGRLRAFGRDKQHSRAASPCHGPAFGSLVLRVRPQGEFDDVWTGYHPAVLAPTSCRQPADAPLQAEAAAQLSQIPRPELLATERRFWTSFSRSHSIPLRHAPVPPKFPCSYQNPHIAVASRDRPSKTGGDVGVAPGVAPGLAPEFGRGRTWRNSELVRTRASSPSRPIPEGHPPNGLCRHRGGR
jgi:hypothetical protein